MNQERSNIKPQSIWQSPRFKMKKKLWNFASAKDRGELSELPDTIKEKGFRSGIFKFGPYEGTLAEIKEFAKMKGKSFLKNGAIKYKIA